MVVRHLQGQGWLGEVEGAGGGQEVTVYLGGGVTAEDAVRIRVLNQ